LGKSEKSFATRCLVGVLRNPPSAVASIPPNQLATAVNSTDHGPEPVESLELSPPHELELSRFRAALLFGRPYDGPGQAFIREFRTSDTETQDLMLARLQSRLKTGKPIFDD
jgi:hypothetical protein